MQGPTETENSNQGKVKSSKISSRGIPLRKKEGQGSMADDPVKNVIDPVDFEDKILRAFSGANWDSLGLRFLLREASEWAEPSRGKNEYEIDHRALIVAALVVGSASKRRLDASRWFAEGLGVVSVDGVQDWFDREQFNRSMPFHKPGYDPVCSRQVSERILPRALELAARTIPGKATFDQRHLLMALLELPSEIWPSIGKSVTAKLRAEARNHIVEMIGKEPVKGEDILAWQAILAEIPDKDDRLSAQRDEPARIDLLGRDVFAKVIANRLVEVRGDQDNAKGDVDRAYFVHLDGPWGSGKSSIINFLKADLIGRTPSWLIVDFNAWREQKNQPPWWALIVQIVRKVRTQLDGWTRARFNAIWWWWLFRNRYFGVTLAVLAILLATALFWSGTPDLAASAKVDWGKIKDILAIVTGVGGLAALFRSAVLGSASSAKALEDLRDDPYAPVMSVFHDLVACAKRPILVIIDDLDRCEGDYVVALLENIQTMLRGEPISYLVAGDRKWITTSFSNRYDEFCESLGAPARPLGHLFLEKLFQLSVTVPRFEAAQLVTYWQSLLKSPEGKAAEASQRTDNEAKAQEIVGSEVRPEELQRKIDAAGSDPKLQQAVREQAAVAIASPSNLKELESRYTDYAPYLERNPRAMKRLVNALGVKQSVLFLEGRKVDPDLLARWTIVELRWPLLAEALEANRDWLDPDEPSPPHDPFDKWMALDDVKFVLEGFGGAAKIDAAILDELFGQSQAPVTAPTSPR